MAERTKPSVEGLQARSDRLSYIVGQRQSLADRIARGEVSTPDPTNIVKFERFLDLPDRLASSVQTLEARRTQLQEQIGQRARIIGIYQRTIEAVSQGKVGSQAIDRLVEAYPYLRPHPKQPIKPMPQSTNAEEATTQIVEVPTSRAEETDHPDELIVKQRVANAGLARDTKMEKAVNYILENMRAGVTIREIAVEVYGTDNGTMHKAKALIDSARVFLTRGGVNIVNTEELGQIGRFTARLIPSEREEQPQVPTIPAERPVEPTEKSTQLHPEVNQEQIRDAFERLQATVAASGFGEDVLNSWRATYPFLAAQTEETQNKKTDPRFQEYILPDGRAMEIGIKTKQLLDNLPLGKRISRDALILAVYGEINRQTIQNTSFQLRVAKALLQGTGFDVVAHKTDASTPFEHELRRITEDQEEQASVSPASPSETPRVSATNVDIIEVPYFPSEEEVRSAEETRVLKTVLELFRKSQVIRFGELQRLLIDTSPESKRRIGNTLRLYDPSEIMALFEKATGKMAIEVGIKEMLHDWTQDDDALYQNLEAAVKNFGRGEMSSLINKIKRSVYQSKTTYYEDPLHLKANGQLHTYVTREELSNL